MNPFRKVWLAVKVKAAVGGNVDALKSIIAWIVKLKIVPSGWLTIGAGVVSILFGVLCQMGVTVPGVSCPTDPTLSITAGLGLIGLGRRGNA